MRSFAVYCEIAGDAMTRVLPTGHPSVSPTLTAPTWTNLTTGLWGASSGLPGRGLRSAPRLEVMAGWIESWLPGSPGGTAAEGYPGEKFGLPADGVNATAGLGRRFAAILVDWVLAYLLAFGFMGGIDALADPNIRWTVLLIWFVITVLGTAILGMTPGKVAAGIRVARTDMAQFVGVPRALLRTLLILPVLPPLARDHDGRGWHDRASTTIVIRTR